uniref:C2 domain-containing protein n=1 Tax=Cucumis melo TaxID=3656 RepID=A0A1S3C803_CUCME
MDLLSLEISVDSAENLKKLDDLSSKMKVYVVVSVTSGVFSEQRAQTNVDMEGGENPRWNFPMNFLIDLNAAKQDLNSLLTFTIKSETPQVHKSIGEIKVRILELFESVGDKNSMRYTSRPITNTLGQTTNARLNFIFKFRELKLQGSVTSGEISEEVENGNVKNNMGSEVAKDMAMKSTTGVVMGGVTGVSNVVAANLMKQYLESMGSDKAAATSTTIETQTFSDTSVDVDQSIDDSSSFFDIICSFFT